MTPLNPRKEALNVSSAFARQLLLEVYREQHDEGDRKRTNTAAAQLQASLEDVLTSKEDPLCGTPGCNHSLFWHEGADTGGYCLKGGCHCGMFQAKQSLTKEVTHAVPVP